MTKFTRLKTWDTASTYKYSYKVISLLLRDLPNTYITDLGLGMNAIITLMFTQFKGSRSPVTTKSGLVESDICYHYASDSTIILSI